MRGSGIIMKYSTPAIEITKFEYDEIIVASSDYEETSATSSSSSNNDDLPQEEF